MPECPPCILIIIALLIVLLIYAFVPGTRTDPKACATNEDCAVFGETGDCNCGCFNTNYRFWTGGGDCFCLAPSSCECVDGVCEGVFG